MSDFRESILSNKKTNFSNVNFSGAQLGGIINETKARLPSEITKEMATHIEPTIVEGITSTTPSFQEKVQKPLAETSQINR